MQYAEAPEAFRIIAHVLLLMYVIIIRTKGNQNTQTGFTRMWTSA